MSIKSEIQGFDISSFSAAVIGCGGLGTNAAVHLAGAGIGRLTLCDYDAVEVRNLNRQFFYTPEDAGKSKCSVLAGRLSSYAPDCIITAENRKIESEQDILKFADCDVIVIAVDNIETRKIVNAFCKKSGKPCINGSINGFFGTAYLYVPGQTPDLESAGMLEDVKTKMHSPSVTVGIIGAMQAKLAVDYFMKNTESQGKLLCYDGAEISTLKIRGETDD